MEHFYTNYNLVRSLTEIAINVPLYKKSVLLPDAPSFSSMVFLPLALEKNKFMAIMGFGLRWEGAIAVFFRLIGVLANVWRSLVYKGDAHLDNKQVAIIASFF